MVKPKRSGSRRRTIKSTNPINTSTHQEKYKNCSPSGLFRWSDFSLNHIPHTPMLLNFFRLLGFLFWCVGPFSLMYVGWCVIDVFCVESGWDRSIYMTMYSWLNSISSTSTLFSSVSIFYIIFEIWMHIEFVFWIWMQNRMYIYGKPLIPNAPTTTKNWRNQEFLQYCQTEMFGKFASFEFSTFL